MRVTFQHLHRFVPANRGDFLIAEACLNQAADCFMTQIVKAKVLNAQLVFDFDPDTVEAVGSAFAVSTWFAKENQVGIDWADWIVQRLAERIGCELRERHGARIAVFCFGEPDDAAVYVDLAASQVEDFRMAHAGFDGDADDPAEHGVGMGVGRCQQAFLFGGSQASVAALAGAGLANVGNRVVGETDSHSLMATVNR